MKNNLREIVFDTETTGLSPEGGDRLVEIGAVELINHIPTGRTYHQYINPERSVPEEVVAVHGLTEEFLKDYPVFAEVAAAFTEFVGDDGILVAHNASFDIKFINYELKKTGLPEYDWERVVDTLEIARKKFSMLCAKGLTWTTVAAPNTALCSMPNCWPKFILSFWAAPNRACCRPKAKTGKKRAPAKLFLPPNAKCVRKEFSPSARKKKPNIWNFCKTSSKTPCGLPARKLPRRLRPDCRRSDKRKGGYGVAHADQRLRPVDDDGGNGDNIPVFVAADAG